MHKKLTNHLAAAAILLLSTAGAARAQCIGCAKASFDAPPSVDSVDIEFGFATGDFDQDGRADAAIPSRGADPAATIHFGDGRGGFRPDTLIVGPGSGYRADLVVASDLDADGLLDLVVKSDYTLQVFVADGTGGFVLRSAPGGPESRVYFVAAADFNGDAIPDLAAAKGVSPGDVQIFLGNGDGTFAPPSKFAVGSYPNGIVTGDFDGDLDTDIAVTNQGDGTFSVLLGDGTGQFSPGQIQPVGTPWWIASGDFNDDGDPDLAVSGSGQPEGLVSIFFGDGTGGFTPGPVFSDIATVRNVLAVDVSGDGVADLVYQGFRGITVVLSQGDGSFGAPIAYGFPSGPPEAADFDQDGDLDVAVGGRNLFVVENGGAGVFTVPYSLPVAGYPWDGILADLNGDSNLDFVLATRDPEGAVTSYLGLGDGTFGASHSAAVTTFTNGLTVAEFTGDGKADVALANGVRAVLVPGDGAGGFGPATYFEAGIFPQTTASGDFNGDGKTDLVVGGSTTEILFGDGSGGFSKPTTIYEYGGVLQVADLNGGGTLDVLVAVGTGLNVLLGDGSGGFLAPTHYEGIAGRFALADFDEDGELDAAGTGFLQGIVLMRGDGAGGFLPPTPIFDWGSYFSFSADFNADGHADLAMENNLAVRITMGDGDGNFGTPSDWAPPLGFFVVMAVGDLDSDGKPDVLTSNRTAAVLLNTNCEPRRLGVASDVSTCAPAGAVFPDQPVVRVYDDGGNVITCDTGIVSASIVPGTGTAGAVLGGDTTIAAVAGVASFSDLAIDLAGTHYQIAFSHPLAGVTRSRSVTVGGPPPPPAASNSGPFCQGQDLNLYATTVPGAVYRWTGPNGFSSTAQSPVIADATLAAAGLYSVIANVDGCESSAATTTVDALPAATGPEVLGQAQVCFGSRLLLRAADPAFLYQWYRNGEPLPGATAAVYSVDQASFGDEADYSVTSSDVTGCTTAVSAPFHVTLVFCHAEAQALAVDPGGNGILEPGETAIVDPTWRNRDIVTLALTGTATDFAGLAAGSYVIVDPTADYGSLEPNASANCLTATGDCYSVMASFSGTRPATHWDAFLDETPGVDPAHTWVLHVGESFTDVPQGHAFYLAIEALLHNAVTAGCTPSTYCPSAGVTRAQMAVLLLKAKYGPQYEPAPATGNVFADVPADAFAAAWIEELERQDITEGCGNGNYCPDQIVTRAQMAVFLLRAEHSGVSPCTGIFADVPCPDGFAVDYIEELYARGVTAGCNASPLLYCPSNPNTRGQMAVFLTRWFELVLYAP